MAAFFPFRSFCFAVLGALALMLASFFTPPGTQAQAVGRLPVVTVMPFDYTGVAPDEAVEVSRRIHAELTTLRTFALVDPVQAEEFIKEAAFRQEVCAGVACAQRLGRKLGVEKVLMGKVTGFDGTRWSVSAELIDVATGRMERSAAYEVTGPFSGLLETAPKHIALQLTEDSPASTAVVMPPPMETPAEQKRDSDAFSPRSGWALYSGYSNHAGTMTLEDGSKIAYSGAAIPSIGVEYQWKLREPLTLGLFMELSGPSTPRGKLGKLYDSEGPSLIALELRYWLDRWYVGGNVGLTQSCFFDLEQKEDERRVKDLCFHGTGFGPAVGYQFPNGVFIGGSVAVSDLGADEHPKDDRVPRAKSATETDVWLNIGYRWGQW